MAPITNVGIRRRTLLAAPVWSRKSRAAKRICRDLLLDALALAPAPAGPVFGMVTRLVPEKGFDLLMPLLDRLLSDDVRLIILGEGDPGYETALAIAARKYPTKFAYRRHYDEALAHLIEAGADVTLIPSQIEPSGLSAMYSLKYGALPVARATGGIQEIIEDYDPTMGTGFGFLCYENTPDAFWDSIKRAREVFHDKTIWADADGARHGAGFLLAKRRRSVTRAIYAQLDLARAAVG